MCLNFIKYLIFSQLWLSVVKTEAIHFNYNYVEVFERILEKSNPTLPFRRLESKQFPLLPNTENDYVYNDELCILQTTWFLEQLNRTEIWAVKMFDSWGKIPVGMYYGNHFVFGNFEECLESFDSNFLIGNLRGQYCTVTVRSNLEEEDIETDVFGMQFLPYMNVQSNSTISIGICIPAACRPEFMKQTLDAYLMEYDYATTDYNQTDFCYRNEPAQPWNAEIYGISFFAIVGVLLLLSTSYDAITSVMNTRALEILKVFSIWTNGRSLFSVAQRSTNHMDFLNGMRVLSITWVVVGHSYMIGASSPNVNTISILDWIKSYHSMLIAAGSVSVDTFFLISGLLVSVGVLRELDSRRTFNYPLYILHRYLRLTPAFGVLIILFVTGIKYFGSGPLWTSFLNMSVLPCQKYWWTALLYIQNYYNPEEICVPHSWYLSVDMQLFILSPLIIYPIWRWRTQFMFFIIMIIILSSMCCVLATMIVNNLRLSYLVSQVRMIKTYYPTHVRMGAWLIGMLLGYYIHKNKGLHLKMPKVCLIIGWISTIVIILSVIIFFYPFQQIDYEDTSILSNAFYEALNRVLWSLAVSWIIFCCAFGYGGFINTFLSAKLWKPIAKLSYCIYLLHLPLQAMIFGSMRTSQYFADIHIIHHFWGDLGFTITIAVIWHLAFEMPFISLERIIFNRDTLKRPTVKIVINGNSFREENNIHYLRTAL